MLVDAGLLDGAFVGNYYFARKSGGEVL